MKEKKESFVFYRSFYEGIKELDDATKLEIFVAICEYSLNEKENELSPFAKAMFTLIKPNIDNASKRYKASVENGKKGGAPKGNQNAKKQPKNNLKQPKNNLNVNEDVNDNDNDNVNYNYINNLNNIDNLNNINSVNNKVVCYSEQTQQIPSPKNSNDVFEYMKEDMKDFYESQVLQTCKNFFEHYNIYHWIDSNGNKITNWQKRCRQWFEQDIIDGKIKRIKYDKYGNYINEDGKIRID